jgi:hypothetical protein
VLAFNSQQEPKEAEMKLMLGKPDDTAILLAQRTGEDWKPNPSLATDMTAFLRGADPEEFELWVEELEDA